ncbi:MAG: AAA family ATPase [Aquisalinus sp.]|nr:AAA family ATPase [Aquisalinus sp.]
MIYANQFQAMCRDILDTIAELYSEHDEPITENQLYRALQNKYEPNRVAKGLNSLQDSCSLEVHNVGKDKYAFVPLNYLSLEPIIFENPQEWFHEADLPERRYLDGRRLIPQNGVTLLFADGAMGKSLLALQLAVGVAHTGDWVGSRVENGSVVYISAEEPLDEIHIRLSEITSSFSADLDDLYKLSVVNWAGKDSLLVAPSASGHIEPTRRFHKLRQRLIKKKPALIIIDSLIDVYGGSIIDPVQAKHALNVFHGLSIELDCPVFILAHPSKSGMAGGDGDGGTRAWNNAARARLYLEREYITEDREKFEPNPDVRLLSNKKANYNRAGDKVRLEWIDGAFHVGSEASQPKCMTVTDSHVDQVFVKLVKQHYSQKQKLSHSRNSHSNYAPKVMSRHSQREGCTERQFRQAMQRCIDEGLVVCQVWGPKARRENTLVLKEDYREGEAPW